MASISLATTAVAGPAPARARAGSAAMMSTFAHEVREPLTALALSSAMLAQDADFFGPREVAAIAMAIHRRAIWLQQLVENLLFVPSIRGGRATVDKELVDLGGFIDEVVDVISPLLTQREQRIRLRGRTGIPKVRLDRRQVGQAVANLLSNAAKFGPERTPIDVRLSEHGGFVRVAVSDRGPGLPTEPVELLFRRFHRAPVGNKLARGLGLGLAIVKEVAAAHGGSVGARPRPGGGATFWFDLPVGSST